ncbi:putative phosphoenolpyruvate synthase [Eufriesea mexicana]|uniref:Putative phosphoenolpyruvate synthase n=2 Tax=Eufriesea mexicana TaxID=516756 RepID=A0A310S601_9HYME|nr:putative phosphoenolpyruvate synthase [Eufriesea mexicana]
MQLTTSDGQLYVSPAYPNTTLIPNLNQMWTAGGLKIECLKFQKRWRIVYNGMLRNLTQSGKCSDHNVEHIRLNFIFIASSQPSRWPEDWSTALHAEALACEPWKNPEWINKIKLLKYTGFDQWGSMLGQVIYKNGHVSTMYLRGLHQHRWGKHESHEFYESVTLFGVMLYGAMFHLNMSNTKHSFPQIQFGQYRSNNERTCEISKIGLKLSDFKQEKFNNNLRYNTWFIADNKEYNILVKPNNSIVLHYGQPCDLLNKIITVKLEMNGKSGIGLIQLWSPYTLPVCKTKTHTELSLLKQINTNVQQDDYIIYFNDGKCQNENIVGGKGFSLGVLTSVRNADFIVPKGFCVTVFAFELQLQTHKELQKVIDNVENICAGRKDGDLQKYCNEAMRIIKSTPIIEKVKYIIIKAIENLELEDDNDKPSRYAIRSSAVGEDSEETSAAGQNSTYLGIQGKTNVIKSIAMCWASLFSYQSVNYRKQHGMTIKASMGVCVQKMVNADAAGVMFTRHPTTGDPSNILITANYGLGESVVSAVVEPDTIIIHKRWNNKLTIRSLVTGNKRQKILVSDNGVVTVDLDNEENETICLSEEIALRLANIGVNLETLFGSARDIEWAVMNETIYLLQARPITTLYTWSDFELTHELDSGVPSDIDMLTFANVGEIFPYPLSPLSISVIAETFNTSVSTEFHTQDNIFFHIVGMKCTLNYYNLFLRQHSKEITLSNKVTDLAISGSIILTPEIHKVICERNGEPVPLAKILVFYKLIKNAIMNSTVEKNAKKIRQNLTLNGEDFHSAHNLYNEINQRYEEYRNVAECHMHTTRVSIFYQIFALGLLTNGYSDIVPEHFSDISILLGSCNDIVSADMLKGLDKIISCIKKCGKDEEFKKVDCDKAINWLTANCPQAAKELNKFLEKHGFRCIQELDFISEPWSLRPENLIKTLQTMITAPEAKNSSKTFDAEQIVGLLKTPKTAITKWILKKLVPFCRKAVVRREMTKAIFAYITHTFRLAYRRLGKLMVLESYLPSEDLIFFLTNEEIAMLLNHHDRTLIQKAFRRKKIFPLLKNIEYPEVNIGMPIPVKNDLNVIIDNKSAKIQGTPVCGGSIVNRACVITDLSDAEKLQPGDILITHSTDIAWSPYFPLLSGIVTELGGLISHGAVIAREYGLPCIVSAKKATQVFQTGDTVLLSADMGVLQLVKKHD